MEMFRARLPLGRDLQPGVQACPAANAFRRQVRVVLRNCGVIDPTSIEEYIGRGGYAMLGRCLTQMQPAELVDVIKASGLRGRGGAAFPTGIKWEAAARTPAGQRFVVCNADEGEPGTSKDRLILEGDPHSILEAMALCGYAIGADRGFIYIRGEYTQSIERLRTAIAQARAMELLGRNLFGSGFDFDIELRHGAGAYVCGEETALFESMEGKRGEPRIKPPYPTQSGLWGRPTVINNVETLANIPVILERGADWFRSLGTPRCPGTKVYTLTGDIVHEGLVEVPMGSTLREVLYGIGGGIPGGRRFKAAQTGGTSGGLLPESLLDVPMDYDQLAAVGTSLGSGALLIMDETRCMVDMARCWARFFLHESCGQCTPCREGTLRLHELTAAIARGEAAPIHLSLLEELAEVMQLTSLCPLGQTAPIPIIQALRYFPAEFCAHVEAHRCPSGVCPVAGPAVAASRG